MGDSADDARARDRRRAKRRYAGRRRGVARCDGNYAGTRARRPGSAVSSAATSGSSERRSRPQVRRSPSWRAPACCWRPPASAWAGEHCTRRSSVARGHRDRGAGGEQTVQGLLADAATELDAARMLTWKAAAAVDAIAVGRVDGQALRQPRRHSVRSRALRRSSALIPFAPGTSSSDSLRTCVRSSSSLDGRRR